MRQRLTISRTLLAISVVLLLLPGVATAKTKVRYSQSGDSLVYAPIYLAKELGYFDAAGIDFELITISGGTQSTAAMTGGSVDILGTAFSHVARTYEAGVHLVAFAALFEQLGLELAVSNQALAKTQVSPQSPLPMRMAALKGLRIGVTSLGSTTDTLARTFVRSAGLNPDTDAALIRMGNGPAMVAGLSQGVIDAFVYPLPFPQMAESKGLGKVLISTTKGEVPEWNGMLYTVMTTTKKYLDENPAVILGLTHAIGRALKTAHENPEEAKKVLRKVFAKVDPAAVELTLVPALAACAKTPVMSREGYDIAMRFHNVGTGKPSDVAFETVVNNTFAERVVAELGLNPK